MSKQSIWNKYEIALIIKGYQTWLRGDAELNSICILLSNTFRYKAEFDGIETDDTYKNYEVVYNKIMNIQYLFTNGKFGLSNYSKLDREIYELYDEEDLEYDRLLDCAYEMYFMTEFNNYFININGSKYVVNLRVTDLDEDKVIYDDFFYDFVYLNQFLKSDLIKEPFNSCIELEMCELIKEDTLSIIFGIELDMLFPLDYDQISDLVSELSNIERSVPKIQLTPEKDESIMIKDNHKKELSLYKYVCPHCWNEVESCTCKSYPYFLIQIDKNILPIIALLNMKGYRTTASCEGHIEEDSGLYIAFKENYDFKELPKDILYKNYIFRCEYEGSTIEEKEENKNRILNELYNWALSL